VLCGYLYIIHFSTRPLSDFNIILVSIVAFLGVVRGGYVATSVCIGIYGDKHVLKKLVTEFWIGTILYLTLAAVSMHYFTGTSAAIVMASLALCNWSFRWIMSHRRSLQVLS
jgi:hypothetical protein